VNDPVTSPTHDVEPRRVPPAEAYELLAAGRAVLADVREPAGYENSHPRGAVSLPYVAVQAAGGRLPHGFAIPGDALLILYCA
jgi:rhodanese-related sulfurtransferase